MTTTTKTERKYKVLWTIEYQDGSTDAKVRLRVGGKATEYVVRFWDDGIGYKATWDKDDGKPPYTVCCTEKGVPIACDCLSRRGCKHRDCTLALVKAGILKIG